MLIRKLFKAEMAHATVGAYTKRCHHLHGHSYKFELYLRSDAPNNAQMVSDFRAVKDVGIGDFFDSFDHAVMLWNKDIRAPIIEKINPDRHLLVPFNPTAEMMAKSFFFICRAIVESGPKLSGEADARVVRVRVHETDTGYAEFDESDAGADGFPEVDFPSWTISRGVQLAWSRRDWYARVLKYVKRKSG
jgi:6-pyruvoyltetrahydropterin/6-carboxytetrahydropterin synthase